jgi:hypothetical protein
LRPHLASISLFAVAVLSFAWAASSAEADEPALRHFLREQEMASVYLDGCVKVFPSVLQEDFKVTYASYMLTLTQAQRILENERKEMRNVDPTPLLIQQQRARASAQDFFAEASMRASPERACREFFRMLRSQDDAIAISRREAKSMDRIDAIIDSLKRSPPPQKN